MFLQEEKYGMKSTNLHIFRGARRGVYTSPGDKGTEKPDFTIYLNFRRRKH
jgi:hypothetical protein